MNNNNIRVAHCTKLWHQSGGYKLSQYIGSYFPDSESTRPDGSQVWIGGAKNNMYIFLCPNTQRWKITDSKDRLSRNIGLLRYSTPASSNLPPIGGSWQVWNEDMGKWSSELWSEKGYVSMDGFNIDLMGS
jgi:hypothetical protein